jgi:tRNA A-37 threonylcarbamoyl transferase component Bud32
VSQSGPTPSVQSGDDPSSDRDERLAELLAELADRAQSGEIVDIDEMARQHPDLADDLRQLWGAVMLADAVGYQASSDSDELEIADEPTHAMELPCHLGGYELLEELGRGGMGVVYRARQKSSSREMAVKMILRGKMASNTEQRRFRAEAEAASGLDHPGIVPVYEVVEAEGQLFFSMEYIAGLTLAQRLAPGPLPAREAASLMAKVSRAIDYAHRHGILHRDMKPSNILIDEKGEPHITDFGLAKQVEDVANLTKTGTILGTPSYMAPEQAAGGRGRMGPATDVYSIGCILYHMLTGRPPFQAASPVDTVLMVLEQDPVPPRVLNPTADRDLEMITMRCLQKPTDLRYESASALADDLTSYLNHESISARSGRFGQVLAQIFHETHHAPVLENWGLLWMWHSLVLVVVCFLTQLLYWREERLTEMGQEHYRWHYTFLWAVVAIAWASIFWILRRRMGPVTFVERQIAHIWAGTMIAIGLLFPLEHILGFHVLSLSPVVAVIVGMMFVIKAGVLSGSFYFQAAAMFVAALIMAQVPDYGHIILGIVAPACFFFPGLKYYRQRRAAQAAL